MIYTIIIRSCQLSWSHDQDHLNKLSFPEPIKTTYEVSMGPAALVEKMLESKNVSDLGQILSIFPYKSIREKI